MGKTGNAAKDALLGAEVGSVAGPWGAVVGGVGGGIYGYLTGDDDPNASNPYNHGGQVDPGGHIGALSNAQRGFANQAQAGYGQLGQQGAALRGQIAQNAAGRNSVSALQLRQGLQANLSQQQMASAGARPQNSSMAQRIAAYNAAAGGGQMAGRQAVAGIQERNQAQQSLGNMIGQARDQDLNAALRSGGQAIQGHHLNQSAIEGRYATMAGQPSTQDRFMKAGADAAIAYDMTHKDNSQSQGPSGSGPSGSGPTYDWMMSKGPGGSSYSDRRLKTNIKDGDADAEDFVESLKNYRFEEK